MKTNTIIILIILILAAANVYQYRNPQVVEVPGEQTPIDSTAWVQRAAYQSRGMLLDSIRNENEKLATEVRKSRDRIANLTTITGRLNLQVDSLESVNVVRLAEPIITDREPGSANRATIADTSYNFIGIFGNGLFRVDSEITLHPEYIENELDLTQTRDIRISVVNTMNDDHSRMLTYVTSKDFEELEYQTYTELKRRKRWPWFLVGMGIGIVGIEIIN